MLKKIFNKYKKLPITAKAALWFVACSMIQKSLTFITVPIFTRLMSTEEYGIYSTYLSWYTILTVICTLNMNRCVYINGYTKADSEEEKNSLAIPMLSLSTLITLIIFIVYLIFHDIFNKIIGLPTLIVCLTLIQVLFEPPVAFWLAKQRFDYKYIKLVIVTILTAILNVGLGIAAVILVKNNQALARVFTVMIVQAIFGITFYIYFAKKGKSIFSIKDWKHILVVELPLLPHELSLTLLGASDRIMINNMIGSVEAGIYSIANSAGRIVNVLKNSIEDAFRPWIYNKIKNKEFTEIRAVCKSMLILIVCITFCFIAFAPEIVMLLAPSAYHEAIYVIPPVAASTFFTFLYNNFSDISFYFEKTKKIMIVSVSGTILNIILNYIFIKKYGFIAAGYTTVVCYVFLSFAHYVIMRQTCKEELDNVKIFDMKFTGILSILVIFMTLVFSLVYSNMLTRYLIILISAIIVYLNKNKLKKIVNEVKKIKVDNKKANEK